MTPDRLTALKDLLEALDTAYEEGWCRRAPSTCHEDGLPHGQRCELCELWGAFCTYKEVSGGLQGPLLPPEHPFTEKQIETLLSALKFPKKSPILPEETPFTEEQLKLLRESPFKGPNDPYPQAAKL